MYVYIYKGAVEGRTLVSGISTYFSSSRLISPMKNITRPEDVSRNATEILQVKKPI
jgi:hypothetical protein